MWSFSKQKLQFFCIWFVERLIFLFNIIRLFKLFITTQSLLFEACLVVLSIFSGFHFCDLYVSLLCFCLSRVVVCMRAFLSFSRVSIPTGFRASKVILPLLLVGKRIVDIIWHLLFFSYPIIREYSFFTHNFLIILKHLFLEGDGL